MPSQDKLIKQGIKYTDSLFEEIASRLEKGVLSSDTLEAFLKKTKEYTTNNPLVASGYQQEMLNLILQETNNHKFTRPAQKELVRVTIEQKVGENIVDVGEEIKTSVRDIVKNGYNNGYSQDKIADELSNRVTSIKNRRARAIARTEIARTATISDYIINKERGATHFTVDCRNTACPVCKRKWLSNPDITSEKRGLDGDVEYSIEDVGNLPPVHPNCRCVPIFINKGGKKKKPIGGNSLPEPTPQQLKKNLTPSEREKYNNYKRNIPKQLEWLRGNPNASADEIAKHQKRLAFLQAKLEELQRKALGGGSGKVTPKPKTTQKPKPKATPKPKETTKAEPPKTETKTPTVEQRNKNLTQKERKEYNDLKYELDWANNVLNNSNSNSQQKKYAKSRITAITPRFNELTNKALGIKTSKPKTTKKTRKSTPKKKEKVVELNKPKNARLTTEECNSLTFDQLAEHHNAEYKGLVKISDDNNKEYHVFEQTFDNGETFKLHIEKGAVNSYKKEGITTANEIIHEVFKVPTVLRQETNELWFRNSQKSVATNKKGTGFKSFAKDEGGMNVSTNKRYYRMMKSMGHKLLNDPDHKIAINPKYFKKLKNFYDIIDWRDRPEETVSWKHAIHHEFTHSIDTSRGIWKNDLTRLSDTPEYKKIHSNERYFTPYANGIRSESFAEHGGFISYMLANPNDHSKLLKIQVPKKDENGRTRVVEEKITFKEYKERYPLHYEYFVNLFKGEIK